MSRCRFYGGFDTLHRIFEPRSPYMLLFLYVIWLNCSTKAVLLTVDCWSFPFACFCFVSIRLSILRLDKIGGKIYIHWTLPFFARAPEDSKMWNGDHVYPLILYISLWSLARVEDTQRDSLLRYLARIPVGWATIQSKLLHTDFHSTWYHQSSFIYNLTSHAARGFNTCPTWPINLMPQIQFAE